MSERNGRRSRKKAKESLKRQRRKKSVAKKERTMKWRQKIGRWEVGKKRKRNELDLINWFNSFDNEAEEIKSFTNCFCFPLDTCLYADVI